MFRPGLASALFCLGFLGCGDDAAQEADAGVFDNDAAVIDGAVPDALIQLTEETEPNNGATLEEVNAVTVPVGMSGAIGTANDVDIFAVELSEGELLQWTIAAEDQNMAPHLAVSEATNEAPVTLAYGAPGASQSFHHFALKTGLHYLIVRDARNVPSAESQNIGDASVRYALTSSPATLSPTNVTIPSRVSHTLPHEFELGIFSFTLSQETDLRIEVFAQRKVPASDIDSRLSLYYVTDSSWLITNDNPALDEKDSFVTGVLPAGEYRVIVDNVDPDAVDLGFELDFSLP
jgi:hypothetical protein